MAINNRGDVLGYSFVLGDHETIGVWDRNGHFEPYYTETISSNVLLFNDNNLIVISAIPANDTSYIVPKPGVRLNLADLVENLPVGQNLRYILDINNHGDMIGFGDQGDFLLERVDARKRASSIASMTSPRLENESRPIPPAAMEMLHRRPRSSQALKSDATKQP